jgi:hypothetical protein
MIWLAMAGLVIGIVIAALVATRSPGVRVIGFTVPVFVFGLPFIARLMRRAAEYDARILGRDDAEDADEKPKRGESLGDLLTLLNEDDIEDLRHRVKARLDEHIETADPDEVESFDALLEEHEREKRA